MIIWIDLDEVLAETVDKVLEDNKLILEDGRKLTKEDITSYYIYEIKNLPLTSEDSLEIFRKVLVSDFDKLKIKPSKWVYNKLLEWKQKWYKLKVITARPSTLFEEYTKKWIDKYYPNIFDDIVFANQNENIINKQWKDNTDKWIICKNLWVDIMIEDNCQYANNVASCWIKTYLIKKPWNKNCILHKNLKKVEWLIEIVL